MKKQYNLFPESSRYGATTFYWSGAQNSNFSTTTNYDYQRIRMKMLKEDSSSCYFWKS